MICVEVSWSWSPGPQYSPLVEIDQEDNVVPEACHSVCSGHGDDERKEVVDESVECLVHESTPEKGKLKLNIRQLMRLYQGRCATDFSL